MARGGTSTDMRGIQPFARACWASSFGNAWKNRQLKLLKHYYKMNFQRIRDWWYETYTDVVVTCIMTLFTVLGDQRSPTPRAFIRTGDSE